MRIGCWLGIFFLPFFLEAADPHGGHAEEAVVVPEKPKVLSHEEEELLRKSKKSFEGEESRAAEKLQRQRLDTLRKQAQEAVAAREVVVAEEHYTALLGMKMEDKERKEILYELGNFYEKIGDLSRAVGVYEKLVELFPRDPELPGLYIHLGDLYRSMDAFDMAISKYFSVLNVSLSITPETVDEYRRLSLQAQIEIGQTYFESGDYERAATFYQRLERLPLDPAEREIIQFRSSLVEFYRGNTPRAAEKFAAFLEMFPESTLGPEASFRLLESYEDLNLMVEANQEVLRLLSMRGGDPQSRLYWQKRAGNRLANHFYQEGQTLEALRIYQAMMRLGDHPGWRWPILYQIGLCFERLAMVPKARDAYRLIVEDPMGHQAAPKESSGVPQEESHSGSFTKATSPAAEPPEQSLELILEMAAWRLEHLGWKEDSERRLQSLSLQ